MVQVPRVITCAAIYQQSGNPPIQYPVIRLRLWRDETDFRFGKEPSVATA
jgi:hypothetical protein